MLDLCPRHMVRSLTVLRLFLCGYFAVILWSDLCEASVRHESATVRAVKAARPSVVNIHGHKTVRQSRERGVEEEPRRVNGMGTGVIIDERGYIVTNHHVVEGVHQIRVTLASGRITTARLIAHDLETDLAVIKIRSDTDLPTINIGTSSDLLPGETVIAVGNAYGYEHTVTQGIVSALHRSVQVSDSQVYDDLIQTDASINPGNSGGPLLNVDGEMIGINVAVRVGAQGIGFALPVDQVMVVTSGLMSIANLENHWHGLTGKVQAGNTVKKFEVDSVANNSPGQKAGILTGDVITEVAGIPIERALDLERSLLGRSPKEHIKVKIIRNKKPLTLQFALSQHSSKREPVTNDRAWQLLGMRLMRVSEAKVQRTNPRYRGGLKVVSVRPSSHAAQQGIRRGDVLVGMHIWETISLENVSYIINRKDLKDLQPLKFYVLRDDETLYGHLPVSPR